MNSFGLAFFLVLSLLALCASGFVPLQASNYPSLALRRPLTQPQLWPFDKKGDNTAVAEVEEKAAEAEEVAEAENAPNMTATEEECVVPEELSETQKLMKQVKDAGVAGVISYALWELGFWTISVPVCIFGYREVTG